MPGLPADGGAELYAAGDRPAAGLSRRRARGSRRDRGLLADTPWFDVFKDDTLSALVRTALERKFDVRIAAERVIQTRERLQIARSSEYPRWTRRWEAYRIVDRKIGSAVPAANAPSRSSRCAPMSVRPGR